MKFLNVIFLLGFIFSGFIMKSQGLKTFYREDKTKISEGILKDGKEDGLWKFWDKKGKLIRESEYHKGEVKGRVTYFYDNGKKFNEGSVENGKQNGLYKEWFRDGSLKQTGKYTDGLKDSIWNTYYINGKIKSVKEYQKGNAYLKFYITSKKDTLIKNGNGNFLDYYSDGKLKTIGKYTEGLKDSVWIRYFVSGDIASKGNYKNGEKRGHWISYYKNGNLKTD
ncbi:MAG: hypothetical protein J7K64_01375, partial [Bacteroidales bacterium]|nr:hypothetical protein [Bacteroidales bacterium]